MPLFASKRAHIQFAVSRAGFILLFAISWNNSFISAQINTGRITGIITDSAGAVVVGAAVRATNQQTGVVTAVQSQESGSYLLNFLIPGEYTVEVESPGFETSIVRGVDVTAGGIARTDVSMHIGQVRQSIEVRANPLAVNTESAELTQSFGYKAL